MMKNNYLLRSGTDRSFVVIIFLVLCLVCVFFFLSLSDYELVNERKHLSGESVSSGVDWRGAADPDAPEATIFGEKLYDELGGVLSFGNTIECEVGCNSDRPCAYRLRADLRIIVLAYNNPERLQDCLDSLGRIQMSDDSLIVDIWIDMLPNGRWNDEVLRVVTHFVGQWQLGYACIHLREKHVGARVQWIYSWMPQLEWTEVTLIIEDDVVLSPLAYKWAKLVWDAYVMPDVHNISGVSIVTDELRHATDRGTQLIRAAPESSVFAYRSLSTGAFAPKPLTWAAFQRWYSNVSSSGQPANVVVPGYAPPGDGYSANGATWRVLYTYFCYQAGLFSLCPNLVQYSGLLNVSLAHHLGKEGSTGVQRGVDGTAFLLTEWDRSYSNLPSTLTYLDYDGSVIGSR